MVVLFKLEQKKWKVIHSVLFKERKQKNQKT